MRKIFVSTLAALVVSTAVHAGSVSWRTDLGGTFMDISGTGTALNLSDDGEVDITTTIGNSVFGAGTVRVGSNGGVRFLGPGTQLGFTNQMIPDATNFGLTSQVLDPFWDDVNTSGGTNGNIYWQEIGNTLIIQWQDVDFFGGARDFATFQIQVSSSGPAVAQFLYQDIEGARALGGDSATIGYQDGGAGFGDAQFSFNTAGSVSNGDVLSLVIPAPGALALLGFAGLAGRRRRRA